MPNRACLFTKFHNKYNCKTTKHLLGKGTVMAHTINNKSAAASVFAYKVVMFFEKIGDLMAKRKLARDTYKSLHQLTDRELNDIGISRGDIRSISEDKWHENSLRDTYPHSVPSNPNLRGSV